MFLPGYIEDSPQHSCVPSRFDLRRLVSVHVFDPYMSTDSTIAWKKSLDENDVTIVDVVPDEVKEMVSLYQNSDSLSRLVILALFDHEKYTKDEIQNFFNCSKYRVDQARKWRKSCEGLLLPKKEKHHRNKLDLVKAEHFIDFVFSSGLLQDVAYGTTNIQYDSGEVQKVAHAVLTSKYIHHTFL